LKTGNVRNQNFRNEPNNNLLQSYEEEKKKVKPLAKINLKKKKKPS